MEIDISLASLGEKNVLHSLMQYYLYEFSSIDGMDVEDDSGMFNDPNLDRYWTEAERHPFIVRANGKLAGFVLVRRGSYFSHQENLSGKSMTIAEFFVMEKYRRQGIGTRVATYIFDLFPDRWEVAQMLNNLIGQAFWRAVIGEYCKGDYEDINLENEIWNGPVQVFDNSSLIKD